MTAGGHVPERVTRHLLVIAAQCRNEPRLEELHEAASALHQALTDPELGGCELGTADEVSLLTGEDLTVSAVTDAVRAAVARAVADQAVLILAFLGHGFTQNLAPNLYYMVADSDPNSVLSAVDVGDLIGKAAAESAVGGVIALVDTCRAGGAATAMSEVVAGMRGGRVNLSILTASAVDQSAYKMKFTFALVARLREGVATDVTHVYPGRELTQLLRSRISGQVVGHIDVDNDPYAMSGLWLARNRGYRTRERGQLISSLGRRELRVAVQAWRPDCRIPDRWNRDALMDLLTFAEHSGQEEDPAAGPNPTVLHVRHVLTGLLECVDTGEFIHTWMGQQLTTELMHSAAARAQIPSDGAKSGSVLLRDLLEQAALRVALVGDRSPWEPLARFVAALAWQAGQRKADAELSGWAGRRGLRSEVNDAFAHFERERRKRELRLVICLDGPLTDWPEEVDAWLLRDDRREPDRQTFPCAVADRKGTERAMGKALAWARGQIGRSEELISIDVAAPAHLLAEWHPEEADVGTQYLGVQHDVTPRWSGYLHPDDDAGIHDIARKVLRRLRWNKGAPVDWVTSRDLQDIDAFTRRLKTGAFRRAIGVDHCCEHLPDVLEMVLPYSPIVLWPLPGVPFADPGALTALVDHVWHVLPARFPEAYRGRWNPRGSEAPVAGRERDDELARLRAAWHDEGWMEFCRWFEGRDVAAPEEAG